MTNILEAINRSELFASLPDYLRSEIAESATERVLAHGEVLFYEGETPSMLYLLVEGELHLLWDQRARVVVDCGSIVDEASVLGGQVHRVRAVAASACRILVWSVDALLAHDSFQTSARLQLGRSLTLSQARLADLNAPIHYSQGAAIHTGPFIFDNASIIFAFCEADFDWVTASLPDDLSLLRIPGRGRAPVFITFADFPNSYPEHDQSARFGYTETSVFVPVLYKGTPGVYIPYLYPSAWEAILIGREVYGFPKQLGHTLIGTQDALLSIDGLTNLSLSWESSKQSNEVELVGALMGWLGIERHLGAAAFQLGDIARSVAGLPPHRRVDVFCKKRIPSVDSTVAKPRYDVDQLVHAVFGVLRWHHVVKAIKPHLNVTSGPLSEANVVLLDVFKTRLDMRLSTGKIERSYQ